MRISTLDGLFAVQYATLTAGTLLTAFLLTLGATAFHIGLVAALPMLGGLLQPAGAEVIRRRGGRRKPVMMTAALVDAALWSATAAAVVWLPPEVAVSAVIGVLAVQQAAAAFVGVAWTSWISDLVPPALRGRFFGRRNAICNAFGALTAAGAGFVVRTAGNGDASVYLALIALGVGFRLVSIWFLSRQPEPAPAQSVGGGVLQQLAQPLAHPEYRKYLTFTATWGFSVHLAAPFFAVYMLEGAAIGVQAVMTFAALGTVSNLLGQRVWGPLCDRYGDRQVMRLTAFSVAIQPLWWLFTGPSGFGYYLMPVLSVTGGFAWAGFALATGNLMMRLAPETGKTSFFAVQAALGGVSGAAGPLVGGVLASLFVGGADLFPGWLFEGLKSLFFISFALRLASWFLLHRVPDPVSRPRLRAAFIIRDTVRTLNPTQGFSPLLHVFASADDPRGKERKKRPSKKYGRSRSGRTA